MRKITCLLAAIVGVLSVLGAHSVCSAQVDFTLSEASGAYYYGYFSQMGSNGFFGDYDVDASSGGVGAFAPLNGWVGNEQADTGQLVAGSNAVVNSLGLSVDPRIGNEWVRVTGRYFIQAYDANTAPGAFVAVSPAQLSMWSAAVTTPVITVGFGKKPFNKGMSLQFAYDRTKEYLHLERSFPVPDILGFLVRGGWLPRGALSWFNPHAWIMSRTDATPEADRRKMYPAPDGTMRWIVLPDEVDDFAWEAPKVMGPHLGKIFESAFLTLGFGFMPWQRIGPQAAFNEKDVNASLVHNYLAYLLYYSRDLVVGAGGLRFNFHQGPEIVPDPALRSQTPTVERYETEGWVFLKYNNGTVFLNSELDWFNRVVRYQRSLDGTFNGLLDFNNGSGSRFASDYQESWRFMAEMGCHYGVFGIRFLYAFLPGPDRRNGILIDRQPFIQEGDQKAAGLFDPYSILLAYRYGGGVNAQAYINDASVYALKIDYALAANLLIEGSVLTARRNSHGYGWGYVRPNLPADGPFGGVNYAQRGGFGDSPPAIPDDNLGWEWSLGVFWEMLQGWSMGAKFSYWQPGDWFKFACVDKGVQSWDSPSAANNWGTNPDRIIDPVVGLELRLGATY